MLSEIGCLDGANHKFKNGTEIGLQDGAMHKIKLIEMGYPDGANHVVWRAADCRGHLTDGNLSFSTLNDDGSATIYFYNQTSIKDGARCTIHLEFDDPITFPGITGGTYGNALHLAHYTDGGSNYDVISRQINCVLYNGNTQVGQLSGYKQGSLFPSSMYTSTTTVQANKIDMEIYVDLDATGSKTGSYTLTWGSGDLMIYDRQIKGIELI